MLDHRQYFGRETIMQGDWSISSPNMLRCLRGVVRSWGESQGPSFCVVSSYKAARCFFVCWFCCFCSFSAVLDIEPVSMSCLPLLSACKLRRSAALQDVVTQWWKGILHSFDVWLAALNSITYTDSHQLLWSGLPGVSLVNLTPLFPVTYLQWLPVTWLRSCKWRDLS